MSTTASAASTPLMEARAVTRTFSLGATFFRILATYAGLGGGPWAALLLGGGR